MDYERLINKDEVHRLPLKRLLSKSYKNAIKKSECNKDYFFVFDLVTFFFVVFLFAVAFFFTANFL